MDVDSSDTEPEYPNFSVQDLVLQGKLLLASSGKEFIKPAGILSSSAEVKKARKEAMGRLGLEFLDSVADEMDLDKELADADESEAQEEPVSPMEVCAESTTRSTTPADPPPTTPDTPEVESSALSARERNRLKRKRKPGNTAFVAAPPPQAQGSRYQAAPAGASKYRTSPCVWQPN